VCANDDEKYLPGASWTMRNLWNMEHYLITREQLENETLAKSNVSLSHLFFQQYQVMADLQNGMEVASRKESNCVRCRNHGLKVTLRGHKQYCPYASCTCDKCRFTAEQQRQMRLQNAIRRAEAHERGSSGSSGNIAKRARELSSPPPTMVATQQIQQQITNQPQVVTVTVQSAATHQAVNGTNGKWNDCFIFQNFNFPIFR
jgi:hypothetical protein